MQVDVVQHREVLQLVVLQCDTEEVAGCREQEVCVCERERCVRSGPYGRAARSSASMFHLEGPDGFFGLLDCEVAPRGHGGAVEQLRVQHLAKGGIEGESQGEGERAEGCPNGW